MGRVQLLLLLLLLLGESWSRLAVAADNNQQPVTQRLRIRKDQQIPRQQRPQEYSLDAFQGDGGATGSRYMRVLEARGGDSRS